MIDDETWSSIQSKFEFVQHELRIFMNSVEDYLGSHPKLKNNKNEKIHSTKKRIKDREHLKEKIERKLHEGKDINPENFFEKITDLSGVRILLLFQADFSEVDMVVREKVKSGDWHLNERPKAYTWDPESVDFFTNFDLEVETKATSYTSVHYVIRPRADSPLSCEIQVRTLFEEIWGEVDHRINYPKPNDSIACREQIRVLSKIVGAGSRLVDSIDRTIQENAERR